MKGLHGFAMSLSVMAWVSTTVAQDNLRERARANGGVAEIRIGPEFGAVSIDDLIAKSAVIVHGRISEVRTHLNATETMVDTDYTVTPHRFLKYDPSLATANSPGRTPLLVVRRPGGTVIDGAIRISAFVEYHSADDTPLGSEVVMFLGYDKSRKIFYVVNGPFGVFRVRDGQMHAIDPETAKRRADVPMSVEAFLADVVARTAKTR